jgi:hypothetical protein
MITQAISLALLTFTGFFIVYCKLPQRVRNFFQQHNLLTDVLCLLATYALLGTTVTALLAAGVVGLLTSAALWVGKNKEDFQYLWDAAEAFKVTMEKLKIALKEQGVKYREGKVNEQGFIPN